MTELPIACTLSAAELQERRNGLLPGLIARAFHRRPLPDGYRWEFAPGDSVLSDLTAMIEAERECCRFLRFALAVELDGGPILLEVSGPPGTREFLEQIVEGAPARQVHRPDER